MDSETFAHLYNNTDRQILKTAEDTLDPRTDRVDEIVKYAKGAGIKHIGIAHCTAFMKEADTLEKVFQDNGLKVDKVHCKYGKVPFNELVEGYKGVSCNPAGQAKYLGEKGTELNVMMGLCLGHDMIFNAKSKAPVTPLVVKDRKLHHHTIDLLREQSER